MNKQNLILTSTTKMSRSEWLEFRQPMNHVRKFIADNWVHIMKNSGEPIPSETKFWEMDGPSIFFGLKKIFASNEWKEFIFPCIGGSEIAVLLALNPYQSIIELYYEKIGVVVKGDFDNPAMFWGRELEEQIAQKWCFWDGSAEGMIDNFTNGKVIRRCRRMNAYVQNKSFPWIFVSLDRIINKQYTGFEETVDEGALECKTIAGYAADMWEAGIPPMYVAQLQTQIMVFEFLFGEIAILRDGRHMDVLPFDKHEGIQDRLLTRSKEFFDMCKAGIEFFLLHTYAQTQEDKDLYYSQLDAIAPEPDGSIAYENYLSERYKDKKFGVIGTLVELEIARQYVWINGQIKDFDEKKRECANKLKDALREASKMEMPDGQGYISWSENKNGVRSVRVNVVLPPDYKPQSYKPAPEATVEAKILAAREKDRKAPADQAAPVESVESITPELPFETNTGTKRKAGKKKSSE